jgi:hypothetical protein
MNLTLQKSKVTSFTSDNADIVGGSSTSISIQILLLEQMNHQILFSNMNTGVNANGNNLCKANGALVQGNIPTQSYVA